MFKMIKEASTNNENRKTISLSCPVSYVLEKIGGRWKPIILWNLRNGKLRYSELKKAIPPITEKMLIQHLKQLEVDNLVVREVINVMPPRVEYSLSEPGFELLPALNILADWGIRNYDTK
jgi:DNA-binding HxlR family transcriptional regulator